MTADDLKRIRRQLPAIGDLSRVNVGGRTVEGVTKVVEVIPHAERRYWASVRVVFEIGQDAAGGWCEGTGDAQAATAVIIFDLVWKIIEPKPQQV